mmetsp:Transcript_23593/g.42629  ORF Transcript_23593/g.42629 Transcript_23593/m.42629 type:complete len:357 (+) Transcript_23593:102-1172(+)|eukprot:CAMPEP_0197629590 /NCGR_PEP_ID=MMETSP1338-20131121/7380_1 /TAXON_ID=43686 ORGANISM="Pelagodinium beii, Strain RCC1491" /NCGR_SAMPLE_ID=MMETSP1338 /ASSEMBLY_ACC=CAM_ASM_000754 /LENGTH=356 /DNA_ID=CAMNT_0043200657 /DNA_START=25 /DNA_END=1095 /DNA_ORIENTATION=-
MRQASKEGWPADEESVESVHSNFSGSHHEEEPHHQTDHSKLGLKPFLCWTGALMIWVIEIVIHVTCGFSKDAINLEEEGECADWIWADYLVVIEGICRSGMAVLCVGLLWTLAGNHRNSRTRPPPLSCPRSITKLAKTASWFSLPVFTLAVGLMGAFNTKEPEWMTVFSHICDVLCHTIITSAIIGFLHDLAVVICDGGVRSLIYAYGCCLIELEASGLAEGVNPGSHDETYFEELRVMKRSNWQICRAASMWFVFLTVAGVYVLLSCGAKLPVEFNTGIAVLNAACWATIAWGVVQGIRRRSLTFFRTITEMGPLSELIVDLTFGADTESSLDETSETDDEQSEIPAGKFFQVPA